MEHQINDEIRDKEVRLINSDGEQLGIVPIQQAQDIAIQKGMDLVKIAPQAKPPVCKIMDYGKFRFEQAKREKEARKNQRVVEIKEIRLTPNIDIGDLNTKVKNACRFLKDGELPYEDESFSFLLAAREAGAPPAARVLRRPRVHSGFVELSLCRAGGAAWEKATRKSPDFKRARKAEPGDGWGEGT